MADEMQAESLSSNAVQLELGKKTEQQGYDMQSAFCP